MVDRIKVITDAADQVRDARNAFNLALEQAARLGLKVETHVLRYQKTGYHDFDQIVVDIAVPVDGLL